eukprot:8422852-Heterocapsa_arctica.AAC.1
MRTPWRSVRKLTSSVATGRGVRDCIEGLMSEDPQAHGFCASERGGIERSVVVGSKARQGQRASLRSLGAP